MRTESNAQENSTVGLKLTAPWRVTKVVPLEDFNLNVTFLDGLTGTVSMKGLISNQNAGIFAVLRHPDVFNQVSIVYGVVTWPGDIDLAPDAMYDAIRTTGQWIL
jgi:hypothetical protein